MILSTSTEIIEKLRKYQQEAGTELQNILAFWEKHAPDDTYGGFIGQLDNQGAVQQEAPKGCILNARILWTFSAAYRHTGEEEYRQLADRAYDYLLAHFVDKTYGGVYWSVTAAGEPLDTRKQIYALSFAIYGLSEYHRATGNTEALVTSQALFRWIEKHGYDPELGGYLEAFSRAGKLLEDLRLSEKDRNDPKTMNTHLHVLEAYANLYRVWPDTFLATQLEKLLVVFFNHIVDAGTGHLHLFFSHDWKPSANLVSYGHDIEAAWLLLEAAEVLGNEVILEKAKALAVAMANATREGLQPDGSLYHELNKDENHYDKHREWWVSAEAMVGFLNAYQLSGDEEDLRTSLNAWHFAQDHLLDQENGEWRWGVYDDYSPMLAEDKIGFWKCPYHNARACMEVVRRCGELLFHPE
ncbi:AGE family epimerase/isomerase [Pontibacter chitinilyticus]|uniref:AGE family epimerase/isomerase n=1 Tax=Pontibacter chitinilyticus TaxID=2674989 RepID=UPI00321A02F9